MIFVNIRYIHWKIFNEIFVKYVSDVDIYIVEEIGNQSNSEFD